jgi:hypothetical protein
MKIFDRAADALVRYIDERSKDSRSLLESLERRMLDGALSRLINVNPVSPSAQNLDMWKRAIMAAKDLDNPDWTQLFNLHENLMLDDHLESVIDSRNAYTKRSAIKFINGKKDENPELVELFERPWYGELVDFALGTNYRGRRLVELYEMTPDNELKTITEIEQPYFNTKKGIILRNPGDSTGWDYRQGPFADNYIQIGKDNNLGMLTRMAPILLAKKLGMGSWLDFIDKYGVPPLFITTDREDDGRLNQLWAAAQKFKSNNFMVGRGQEKFEVGDVGSAGIDPIEKLVSRADDMVSKRVLGGTGLTDEKSFVGSVGIQYKIAIDRFESDRLLWKYFFNTEVRPRLIKLSPVYAPLKDFKLEYDDTERLSQKERIDIILALANSYEVDPEYITQETGIPILGTKQSQPAPIPGGVPAKK